jgi:hypothetical protein
MSDLRQVVYVSTATPKFSDAVLESILTESRANNAKVGVTGMLVYADGSVMQAIEGPPAAIGDLMAKIASDTRHAGISVIWDHPIAKRGFPDWRMAYARCPRAADIDNCVDLLRSREPLMTEFGDRGAVGTLMRTFLENARA